MIKKKESTYEKLVNSLNPKEKAELEKDYKDLLISEMFIAAMQLDTVSVRKLAQAARISSIVIQNL